MSISINRRLITLFTSGLMLSGFSSPSLATANLFICNVPATAGGCANGASAPTGFMTFDFSGFLPGNTFIGGLPAGSPATAPTTGPIDFSFFWQTTSPGTNTPVQTIFFTEPDGLVADVLNYVSSVSGGAGSDFMNLFGYVEAFATPVTVAYLTSQGVTATGSTSATGLYDFTATDLAGTFQPGAIPELPTWGLILLGFAGLSAAGARAAQRRVASVQSPAKS